MYKNFRAGIVSVTFRQYAYINFIKYTKLTELSCIEWGSDIHVAYNNPEKAQKVAAKMKDNNLETAAYGSYYRLGNKQHDIFSMILNTAKILQAPLIRVWGGTRQSALLNAEDRQVIINDAVTIASAAKAENINISAEYHSSTITDNADSAVDFIKAVRDNSGINVYLYWQPNQNISFEENKAELKKICPYLSNIHVFAMEATEKFPLDYHKNRWTEYIDIIKEQTDSNSKHSFMLEFVKGDTVEQFVQDADVLLELLA